MLCQKGSLYPPFEVVGGSLAFWVLVAVVQRCERLGFFRCCHCRFGYWVRCDLLQVGSVEGSRRVGEAVEKEGDERSQLAAMDKIRRNNHRIRSVRNEIAVVRKELSDLRNLRNFGYVDNEGVKGEGKEDCAVKEVPCEAPDEVAGPANEATADEAAVNEGPANEAGPGNEAVADEVVADEASVDEECGGKGHEEAAHEEGGHEGSEAHEERASESHEEGPANADEVVAVHAHEQGANEEPVAEPLVQGPPLIDIGDDDDVGHVEPKLVVPLHTYNGDPRTIVDVDTLYNAVTRRDIERR
ncbi:hypothetical protein V8G54_023232 [Vigna mungo]|uniref:Uncharacterized protein n=1 Tax=Vigna mungo TaxID=3915 RepID=A0AAQ3N4F9_VIGMU